MIDEAICFAGEEWRTFDRSSPLAPNIHIRDRIAVFSGPFRIALTRSFPDLELAPDEVLLLIIAKGIEKAGTLSRPQLERRLGIVLPP